MSVLSRGLVIVVVGLALSACAAEHRARSDSAIFLDGDRLHTGTGATISSGSGSTAGGAATRPEPTEPRGNTPPGTSRDGQGPAAGAIVDPTGAATK